LHLWAINLQDDNGLWFAWAAMRFSIQKGIRVVKDKTSYFLFCVQIDRMIILNQFKKIKTKINFLKNKVSNWTK